jgi:glycosyltransferase involved in cell wall biosynthesis
MAAVSILIPSYNSGPFLGDTIKSVCQQSFTDWELIISDDCSTDNTYQVALDWATKDERIKVYRNEQNLGMLENWNKGIELCHSPYFVKLDGDDLWYPSMLEKAMNVLQQNEEVGLVFSRFEDINDKGKVEKEGRALPPFASNKAFSCVPLVKEGPSNMFAYHIMLQGLSVMRRNVFDEIGKYRYLLTKETQAATDTEFYFRVGAHYKIFCIDEILYQYRVHAASLSVQHSKSFMTEKKNYELKHTIIEYYCEQGLISKKERDKFIDEVERLFSYIIMAEFRKRKQWGGVFRNLVRVMAQHPIKTIEFYKKRWQEKSGEGKTS